MDYAQYPPEMITNWLSGHRPRCGHRAYEGAEPCNAGLYAPVRIPDPDGLGRELWQTRCAGLRQYHTIQFEVVRSEVSEHSHVASAEVVS